MIDYFCLALTNGLMLVAAWRLLFRADLDHDDPDSVKPARPWLEGRNQPTEPASDA